MTHARALAVAALLFAAPLLGQQEIRNYPLAVTANCPVGLTVRHAMNDGLALPVRSRESQPGPSQRLHIELANTKPSAIASIDLTAIGYGMHVHARGVAPAASGSEDTQAQEIRRDINLNLKLGAMDTSVTEIDLPAFTAVARVDVKAVLYADGTQWTAAEGGTCTAVPDPMMLVHASADGATVIQGAKR